MPRILRNIVAVIAGWFGGVFVNMTLVNAGYKAFPIEGLQPDNMEALAAAMSSFGPENFIFPFLAHALGTLVGALISALIAGQHKIKSALAVGIIFLLGGIVVNYMLSGPIWFAALDILLAYIPMAWVGGKIALSIRPEKVKSGL